MSYLDQQFDLRDTVADLPDDIKRAIGEVDVVSEVWEIGRQFHLIISEIGDLCEETKKVIVGETHPENFINAIHEKLGAENKNKANQIGTEINNRILIPIRNAYQKTAMGDSGSDLNQQPARTTFAPQNLNGQATNNPEGKSTSYGAGLQLKPEQGPDSNAADSSLLNANYSSDRDFLMHEIENPTPVGVSTMTYREPTTNDQRPTTGEAPANLPTENPLEREIPVIRTMPRDMAKETNNPEGKSTSYGAGLQPSQNFSTQNLGGRGKFGHGTPPTIRQNRQGESPETPRTTFVPPNNFSKENLSGQAKNNETKNVRKEPPSGEIASATANTKTSFIPRMVGQAGGTIDGVSLAPKPPSTPVNKPIIPPTPTPRTPQKQNAIEQPRQSFESKDSIDQAQKPYAPQVSRPSINLIKKETGQNLNEQARTNFEGQNLNGQTRTEKTPEQTGSPKTEPLPAQKTSFVPINKAEKVDNVIIEDKLTKTVNIPSEKKRYIVDPYREPLE
ncbi:MAG TPA: hypothetical protein VJI33_02895 [Candidatus Paceibacterota bacterium]